MLEVHGAPGTVPEDCLGEILYCRSAFRHESKIQVFLKAVLKAGAACGSSSHLPRQPPSHRSPVGEGLMVSVE